MDACLCLMVCVCGCVCGLCSVLVLQVWCCDMLCGNRKFCSRMQLLACLLAGQLSTFKKKRKKGEREAGIERFWATYSKPVQADPGSLIHCCFFNRLCTVNDCIRSKLQRRTRSVVNTHKHEMDAQRRVAWCRSKRSKQRPKRRSSTRILRSPLRCGEPRGVPQHHWNIKQWYDGLYRFKKSSPPSRDYK